MAEHITRYLVKYTVTHKNPNRIYRTVTHYCGKDDSIIDTFANEHTFDQRQTLVSVEEYGYKTRAAAMRNPWYIKPGTETRYRTFTAEIIKIEMEV